MRYDSIFRPNLFSGQTIIVTGGGTGIGRAIAHELAALGGNLIIASRKQEPLDKTAAEIRAAGGQVSTYQLNIRDAESVSAFYDAAIDEHGTIHALVNNAGGQFMSPANMINDKGWHAVIDTNLNGTFRMSREVFNRSMQKNGGTIINIVAEMWRGFPGMAHTGAARAGVVNMTKTLAIEWAFAGVRINAVAPGLIDGNGFNNYGAAVQDWIQSLKKDVPVKRFGTEAEIAAAVTFLLSPAAAYITGTTLNVDGGSSLWRKSWQIDDHDKAPPPYEGFEPSE